MNSSSEPLPSNSTVDGVRRSMATNELVPVRNVSVVEGGVNLTSASSSADIRMSSMDSNVVGDMNTGSDLGTSNNTLNRPTAIPADDGDVPQASGLVAGGKLSSADAIAPRDVEAGRVTYDDTDANSNDGDEPMEEDEDEEDENNGDDESDYSYDYEEEDETHYSGFLIPTEPLETSGAAVAAEQPAAIAQIDTSGDVNVVMALENEKSCSPDISALAVGGGDLRRGASRVSTDGDIAQALSSTSNSSPEKEDRKQKWKEPTRAAVHMSLRVEKEKTGGRRRLASDLYRIMLADNKEAGFSLEPCDEDSMDKWSIKLFDFDEDSNLAKDLTVIGMEHVELEMSFPEQYPFEPPFVRVVRPRFKKQTGFVMNGALCMELLTKDGWNPINDIESVIVSIRSLMVVGDGRLQAAVEMGKEKYNMTLAAKLESKRTANVDTSSEANRKSDDDNDGHPSDPKRKKTSHDCDNEKDAEVSSAVKKSSAGSYTAAEASAAYDHLSKFHKSNGWDKSGWWAKKG